MRGRVPPVKAVSLRPGHFRLRVRIATLTRAPSLRGGLARVILQGSARGYATTKKLAPVSSLGVPAAGKHGQLDTRRTGAIIAGMRRAGRTGAGLGAVLLLAAGIAGGGASKAARPAGGAPGEAGQAAQGDRRQAPYDAQQRPAGPELELDVVVGDAEAGHAYFEANCASCHSAAGDLAGIATRIPDPKTLQHNVTAYLVTLE